MYIDMNPVLPFSMTIISILSFLLLYKDINYEIPRPVTWLDMLGAYIMTIFMTMFLNGALNSGNYTFGFTWNKTSEPESFTTLAVQTISQVSPFTVTLTGWGHVPDHLYEIIPLPQVLFGFILCLIFVYCCITAILKILSIHKIPYTDNSKMNTLIGFNYKNIRLFIMILFVTSTLFCIGVLLGYIFHYELWGGFLIISKIIYFIFFFIPDILVRLLGEFLLTDFIHDIGSYSIYINYSRSIHILILSGVLYILSGIEQIIRNSDYYNRIEKSDDVLKYSVDTINVIKLFYLIMYILILFVSGIVP